MRRKREREHGLDHLCGWGGDVSVGVREAGGRVPGT